MHDRLSLDLITGIDKPSALIEVAGDDVLGFDVEGYERAVGCFEDQLRQRLNRGHPMAFPLVAGIDHHAIDPIVTVFGLQRVHGETDGFSICKNDQGNTSVALRRLIQGIGIAGHEVLLLGLWRERQGEGAVIGIHSDELYEIFEHF